MITLVDGLGQMGSLLKEKIKKVKTDTDVVIYHKWNPWEKDNEEVQKQCFEEFKTFVDSNKNKNETL